MRGIHSLCRQDGVVRCTGYRIARLLIASVVLYPSAAAAGGWYTPLDAVSDPSAPLLWGADMAGSDEGSLPGPFAAIDELETPPPSASTLVSLTFDDTHEDQQQVRSILSDHGLHATFFVNSSRIGRPGYMTLDDLLGLQADGNEIGGHTVTHARLPSVDADEQRRQICDDRAALLAQGFAVTSFAYPYADASSISEDIVAECGYNSGRGVGGLVSPTSCSLCPLVERVPPGAPYHTRTADSVKADTELDVLKGYVMSAEQTGGWLQIVMHHVCDGCSPLAISPASFTEFLDWLTPRGAIGTHVGTVHEVLGGAVAPAFLGPLGTAALRNPSFEDDADGDGLADCWQDASYGVNDAIGERTADARSGGYAQHIAMTSLASGDNKLITRQDLGACAPAAAPRQRYEVRAWYRTDAVVHVIAYYRTNSGNWRWWAQSAPLAPSDGWVQATWQTPPAPPNAAGLSVGVSIRSPGSLWIDDVGLSPWP